MTATSTIAPARQAPALLGQTVVVIGGSGRQGLWPSPSDFVFAGYAP